tara:strand:+ start:720 stop:962 length:243 start_codon:yes stop_codon:yes gene_type:complete
MLGAGVDKLTTINDNTERIEAGYVNSCKNGFKLLKPSQLGRKKLQIIVTKAPVIIEATAPSLVARFHKKAAKRDGVIDVP